MDNSHSERRAYWCCLLVGFALTSTALFLHPMSPEDFLGLAFSNPLLTILDANSGGVAVFFWISISVMLSGFIGLLGHRWLFRRLHAHIG